MHIKLTSPWSDLTVYFGHSSSLDTCVGSMSLQIQPAGNGTLTTSLHVGYGLVLNKYCYIALLLES